MLKRCIFCGRFFNSDPRVKNQKACCKEQCKKARQQLAFSNWCKRNPGYFKGRYSVVKEWREKKKEISKQKQVSQSKTFSKDSVCKFVLLIPRILMNKVEIQEYILLRKVGRSTFLGSFDRKITIKQDDTKRDTPQNTSNDAGGQRTDTLKDGMIQNEICLQKPITSAFADDG